MHLKYWYLDEFVWFGFLLGQFPIKIDLIFLVT